ncbi:MAG: porin family protein [Succinivibrionaceae bacterium]|nr:porin family protein [Succinivibrionaceae bacterium]
MKHKLLVLCALMSLSTVCAADVTGYGSIRSGVSNLHIDTDYGSDLTDTVANLGVAGGARFRDGGIGGRVELEWTHYFKGSDTWRDFDIDFRADSLMVNGYLDLYPADWVNFYLTAGAGVSWADIKPSDFQDKNSSGSFKGGAGVMFNIGDHFSIDLGYRYTRLASDMYSHDAQAGFTFNF